SDAYLRARIRIAVSMCRMNAAKLLALAVCYGNADSGVTFANLYRDAVQGNPENWEQYYRCSASYNCTARLKRIQAPMLLMFGKKDRKFYRYADILQKQLPHRKLVMVRGVHHQLPTKAGAAVSES